MSRIANRREMIAAVHALAKTNAPTDALYKLVAEALARVASDDSGQPCEVTINFKSVKDSTT